MRRVATEPKASFVGFVIAASLARDKVEIASPSEVTLSCSFECWDLVVMSETGEGCDVGAAGKGQDPNKSERLSLTGLTIHIVCRFPRCRKVSLRGWLHVRRIRPSLGTETGTGHG